MSLSAELVVSNWAQSLRFYTDVLGFTTMRFDAAARYAELERDGVSLIITQNSSGLAPLEYPYGRGVTFTIWTQDAEAVYAGVHAYGARLHAPMQEIWQEEDGVRTGHIAFAVIDPDGYALRFCEALPPDGY